MHLAELLAQLGVLHNHGQELCAALARIVHAVPCQADAGAAGLPQTAIPFHRGHGGPGVQASDTRSCSDWNR
jgi:hypothetical protein